MNIHITLVVYALDITPLWVSFNTPRVTWHVFNHGSNEHVISTCEHIRAIDSDFHFYDYGVNRGLARSWNEGLMISQAMDADVMMIANDDITASADDVMKIASAAMERRDYGVIEAVGYEGGMGRRQSMNFALCAINPIALERVGYFDENFFPLYFEDSDWSRRCGLAGVRYFDAGETGIVHAGSQSIRTVPELNSQNNTTFAANHEYYVRKWNGEPGQEAYAEPFDGRFSLRIAAKRRHTPYGEFDRTDREIVRI